MKKPTKPPFAPLPSAADEWSTSSTHVSGLNRTLKSGKKITNQISAVPKLWPLLELLNEPEFVNAWSKSPLSEIPETQENYQRLKDEFARLPASIDEAETLMAMYPERDLWKMLNYLERHPVRAHTVFLLIDLAVQTTLRRRGMKAAVAKHENNETYRGIKANVLAFFTAAAASIDPSTGLPRFKRKSDFLKRAFENFKVYERNGKIFSVAEYAKLPDPSEKDKVRPSEKAIDEWLKHSGLPMPSHWKTRK